MKVANEVMEDFMKKLGMDEYKKEYRPNRGPEINENFVNEQVMSYSRLLKSDIMKVVMDD